MNYSPVFFEILVKLKTRRKQLSEEEATREVIKEMVNSWEKSGKFDLKKGGRKNEVKRRNSKKVVELF